jgi:dihydrofolate reductase
MGKLIYSMSVSLDGFAATKDHSLDWVHVDEELHEVFNEEARQVGTFLHGRRMWELMSDYWPTGDTDPGATPVERDFARIWRDKPKVVLSSTLDHVDWNARLVREDAVAGVARLKAASDQDMDVGGPTLAATFLAAGLVDEVRTYVNPVILGDGLPFFPELQQRIRLRLLDSRNFGSGVVALRYAVDND